jgi:alpha-maltose-1-phosphate synthase
MTTAIYFHPEAYSTQGPKLMGRNAAGESFLRGYFTYSQQKTLWTQVIQADHAQAFADSAIHYGRNEPIKAVTNEQIAALREVNAVYYPGPNIDNLAWQRSHFGHDAWSLCGITHTTSSANAMDAISQLITAPIQPWDAIICTSTAVKNNVNQILQAQADYLSDRLKIKQLVLPQLPVIPLGIHTKDFEFTPQQKKDARTSIGADNKTHVVLYMGRLSFHAKAHPLAMYQALEDAAQQLPENEQIILIECGWFANDAVQQAYREAQTLACPSIRVMTLDGRVADNRQTAWASADVFCSLSDNIQETFGITPIEAMATGIPVIVSDWNGYKDSVTDGEEGYRIPTLMPTAGLGKDLAYRHALGLDNYDRYCGQCCSLISVDIKAATEAFTRLFESATLRTQLGKNGRKKAREIFDWSTIIPRYEQLWGELNSLRSKHPEKQPTPTHSWPARLDPFHSFASYPTQLLNATTQLRLVDDNTETALQRLKQYQQLEMVNFSLSILPTENEIEQMFRSGSPHGSQAIEWVKDIAQERQAICLRGLSWLVKLGLLMVVT